MPLVRIDLIEGRTDDEVRAVADAVHLSLLEVFGIPPRDRFQIITEHPRNRVVALDAGLGFERGDATVMVQILTQQGRSVADRQRLYAVICAKLGEVGVGGQDVFVGYSENTSADWSFGFGRAQYVEGDLAVPGADG